MTMERTPAEQQEQLDNEVRLSDKAKQAYKTFIEDFVEQKRFSLFAAFRELPLTAETELMEVKRMLFAVDQLESEVLTVMNTGKMAAITLAERAKAAQEELEK